MKEIRAELEGEGDRGFRIEMGRTGGGGHTFQTGRWPGGGLMRVKDRFF